MVVYITTNLINGKKYVGKDARNQTQYLGSGKELKRDILKYGKVNFKKEILQTCKNLKELADCELEWLKRLDCKNNPQFYNLIDGYTPSRYGKKLTEEHKNKIRESHKGKRHTSESIEKMKQARRGVKRGPCPQIIREKISKARKGKNHTPETIEKIKQAHKGVPKIANRKPIQKINPDSGVVEKVYSKIIDVEQDKINRFAVSNVLAGRSRTANGFLWKYVD